MKKIIDEKLCTGCSACMNICPKNAITMIENNSGFKYPQIDNTKCINCGMCKKTCPILNFKEENKTKLQAYACYNKNVSERIRSSSGGIFVLLAKEIIKRHGVVFGASFDEKFIVRHSCIQSEKDIEKLMGSKYTQSEISYTFKEAKKFLDSNRYVLFTGTPCQIEGLKAFLKKDYEKLYTQDIICHGVPSPKVWQKYLKYQEEKFAQNIEKVSFRNKDLSWELFQMKIDFKNKVYSKDLTKDPYMKLFLENVILRDSCYDCKFKKKYRISDITLADYWGINEVHCDMNDNCGTSLVILHSEKGKELFECIKRKTVFLKTDINKAIKYNSAMTSSVKKNPISNDFWKDYEKVPFEKLIKKYVPKKSIIKKILSRFKRILMKIFANKT